MLKKWFSERYMPYPNETAIFNTIDTIANSGGNLTDVQSALEKAGFTVYRDQSCVEVNLDDNNLIKTTTATSSNNSFSKDLYLDKDTRLPKFVHIKKRVMGNQKEQGFIVMFPHSNS